MNDFLSAWEKWTNNCRVVQMAAVLQRENGNVKLKVSCPPEYMQDVEALANFITQEAMKYALKEVTAFQMDASDVESEINGIWRELINEIDTIVNCLFENGFDAFNCLLSGYRKKRQTLYEVGKLHYQSGNWYNWRGDIFDLNDKM